MRTEIKKEVKEHEYELYISDDGKYSSTKEYEVREYEEAQANRKIINRFKVGLVDLTYFQNSIFYWNGRFYPQVYHVNSPEEFFELLGVLEKYYHAYQTQDEDWYNIDYSSFYFVISVREEENTAYTADALFIHDLETLKKEINNEKELLTATLDDIVKVHENIKNNLNKDR